LIFLILASLSGWFVQGLATRYHGGVTDPVTAACFFSGNGKSKESAAATSPEKGLKALRDGLLLKL
jgi:hypothetical protein